MNFLENKGELNHFHIGAIAVGVLITVPILAQILYAAVN